VSDAYAKPPRTHARTAAASSQPRAALRTTLGDFAAASEPQDRRMETAIVRHRRDTAPDPGPRSHCRAGLSFAADACAYSELGSRAKTGCKLAARRESAVTTRLRTKRPSAIAQRSRSASAHLRRRACERPQPGAAPGCNPPFVTLSIGLDPGGIARSAASDADTARLIMMPLRVGAYALRP